MYKFTLRNIQDKEGKGILMEGNIPRTSVQHFNAAFGFELLQLSEDKGLISPFWNVLLYLVKWHKWNVETIFLVFGALSFWPSCQTVCVYDIRSSWGSYSVNCDWTSLSQLLLRIGTITLWWIALFSIRPNVTNGPSHYQRRIPVCCTLLFVFERRYPTFVNLGRRERSLALYKPL